MTAIGGLLAEVDRHMEATPGEYSQSQHLPKSTKSADPQVAKPNNCMLHCTCNPSCFNNWMRAVLVRGATLQLTFFLFFINTRTHFLSCTLEPKKSRV